MYNIHTMSGVLINTYTFNITSGQLDQNDNLKPEAIFDILQEAATIQAEENGLGFYDLIKDNLIWVLIRQKYQIIKRVKELKKVKVKTWPLKPNKIDYMREFEVYDLNDELLIKASSVWTVFNLKTKFVEIRRQLDFNKGYWDKISLESLKKLNFKLDENFKYVDEFKVYRSYYDRNKHMNNAKYVEIIFNSSSFDLIDSIQVDFIKQCYLNDVIKVYKYQVDENNEEMIGISNDSVVFKCCVEGKINEVI